MPEKSDKDDERMVEGSDEDPLDGDLKRMKEMPCLKKHDRASSKGSKTVRNLSCVFQAQVLGGCFARSDEESSCINLLELEDADDPWM
jgi:hypothetical protein